MDQDLSSHGWLNWVSSIKLLNHYPQYKTTAEHSVAAVFFQILFWGCTFSGVYLIIIIIIIIITYIYNALNDALSAYLAFTHMPGGVTVGNSGLCCCVLCLLTWLKIPTNWLVTNLCLLSANNSLSLFVLSNMLDDIQSCPSCTMIGAHVRDPVFTFW